MPTTSDPLAEAHRSSGRSSMLASGSILLGALCLSFSAIFVKLAGVDAATTAFLRCAIALVVLVPLAVREARRHHRLSATAVAWAAAAGAALGIDYSAWTAAIYAVGAGVSTVLINVQVIVLPLLALVVDREPVSRRFVIAAPVMLIGIALVGGLGAAATRDAPEPGRGTVLGVLAGVGYGIYLFLTRRGGRHDPRLVLQPLAVATASAALTAAALSTLSTGLDLTGIEPRAWALLVALALLGQVVAWLLIHHASPRLSPSLTAALLLTQPVLALVISAVVLGERPRSTQLLGAAVVLGAMAYANRVSTGGGRGADRGGA